MGYKPFTDSTLKAMTKKEIIECVRVAEHNFFAYKEANENQHKYLHELNAENAELKRLLKLIYDEMQEAKICWTCAYRNLSAEDKTCYICGNANESMYKWEHADEAMKLIGEGDNK